MAEIAVLRTHIVNYARTRDTYTAYRKAGYSPKFRSEHEADILLHQAAKRAFDELNVKKLPKMKDLQAEYATLLAEKKAAYTELRKGPRRGAGAADRQDQCGPRFAGHRARYRAGKRARPAMI